MKQKTFLCSALDKLVKHNKFTRANSHKFLTFKKKPFQ